VDGRIILKGILKIQWKNVDWNNLAQGGEKRRTHVDTVMDSWGTCSWLVSWLVGWLEVEKEILTNVKFQERPAERQMIKYKKQRLDDRRPRRADSRAVGPVAVTCWQTVSHWACLRKHGPSGLRPHHRLTGDRERYPHMDLPQLGWRTVRHSGLVRAKVERATQRALSLFLTQYHRSGIICNLKAAKWSETWRWKLKFVSVPLSVPVCKIECLLCNVRFWY